MPIFDIVNTSKWRRTIEELLFARHFGEYLLGRSPCGARVLLYSKQCQHFFLKVKQEKREEERRKNYREYRKNFR